LTYVKKIPVFTPELHRYLADQGIVLDHPVTIRMPVNLRKDGDKKSGNKLGIVLVKLVDPTTDR